MNQKLFTIIGIAKYRYYLVLDLIGKANVRIKNIILNNGERIDPNIEGSISNNVICHIARYNFAKSNLPNNTKNCLDLACGTGYGTKILSQNNIQVTGVDISPLTIIYNKLRYFNLDIQFIKSDFIRYSVKHDVVVSFETLEHLEYTLIKSIGHLMKLTNKVLIISVPYNEPEGNNHHHRLFNITEIDIVQSAKNAVIDFYYQNKLGKITSKKIDSPQNLICVLTKARKS